MANIVVKEANGTTDFTWTAMSASPGDGGIAQWRQSGSSSPALAGNLRCSTAWNKAKTVRQVEINGDLPVVAVPNGIETVVARPSFRMTFQVPNATPGVDSAKFAAVMTNALASVLVKEVISTGFAPT